MINRLMISAAAAALIAGTGFANAQGMNREAPSAGAAGMQQSAPSSDRGSSAATPMNRDSGSDQGMKSTQSDEKMEPQGGKTQHTQGDMKSGAKGEKSAQENNMNNNNMSKGDKSNSMRSESTTVIRDQHIAPVTNVNFSISVGTRVPRDVSFHPLPAEIVTIYPDWRGYEFILVRDQIIVVDPRSFEIVAILDA